MDIDHEAIADTIVNGPPRDIYKFYAPRLSSEHKEDDKDLETKMQVIQDFADLDDGWVCQRFPGQYFPLDLYAHQQMRNWLCIEVKHAASCDLEGLEKGPSTGAFIPYPKLIALAAGVAVGFDYSVLVYRVSGDRYYIPGQRLFTLLKTSHPLPNTDAADREGNLSMPISTLTKWKGLEPLMRYIRLGKF